LNFSLFHSFFSINLPKKGFNVPSEEKVEELLPQLDRFKQNIITKTVDGDPEETNRRRGLTVYVHRLITAPTAPNRRCSTFEKIEEISQKLLAKSVIARFTDKGEDSKIVARLIERLREAIVCYQVGNYCVSASSVIDRG